MSLLKVFSNLQLFKKASHNRPELLWLGVFKVSTISVHVHCTLVHIPGHLNRPCMIPWLWSTSILLHISSTVPVGWECFWEDTLSCEWDVHYPSVALGCVHCCHASLPRLKGNDDQGDWDFALPAMHIRLADLGWDKLHIVFIDAHDAVVR